MRFADIAVQASEPKSESAVAQEDGLRASVFCIPFRKAQKKT